MMRHELTANSPLRRLERKSGEILLPGDVGVVLSPAGVGKTAFVVQVAIDAMLRGEAVLFISIGDSIEKITVWFSELFQNRARCHGLQSADDIWQEAVRRRFIMTFKVARFSVPILEERLADLMGQKIFVPSMVVIDGLDFDGDDGSLVPELGRLAKETGFSLWLTGPCHRDDDRRVDGIPRRFEPAEGFLERILLLNPGEATVSLVALKGLPEEIGETGLFLDPATMLVRAGKE